MTLDTRLFDAIDETNEWQEPLYRHLHANPELSMQEFETLAEITRRLDEYGYTTHQIGGGVVGVLANGDGPTVLFRADFDALPVKEDTGLEYASTRAMVDRAGVMQPVMHACGHDFHITAALGAAKILSDNTDAWAGTYLALFQPGEETAEGAQAMVDAGITDQIPTPDVALGQHVMGLAAGQVQIAPGAIMSTATSMKVTVHGKGSHGSMPHLSIDPIVLAAAIVTRIQTVVAREIPPSEFGVVTVGALHAGSKSNIIPADATMLINFRAYSPETLTTLVEAVQRIVRAECEAARSPKAPEFSLSDRFPLTENDHGVAEKLRAAFAARLGRDRVSEMPPSTGSEDFSLVPRAFGTPYCFWVWGGFEEGGEVYANHNPKFAPVLQPTLRTGTETALTAALTFLGR